MSQSSDTPSEIPTSGEPGCNDGKPEQVGSSQPTSTPCATPSSSSKERWKQPKTARQFASQVNAVATKLLNGTLDSETAKAYSSLARTVAQTITAEVQRSRFLENEPDLSFDEEVFEA